VAKKRVDTDRLLRQLRDHAAVVEHDRTAVVAVGYSTLYALYVHEDLTMNHPRGGQAKFLEQPARLMRKQLVDEVIAELAKRRSITRNKGRTFAQALLRAGRLLEKESKKLVPVDTGFLWSSGFTMLEERK
jgi:hypothetical protein